MKNPRPYGKIGGKGNLLVVVTRAEFGYQPGPVK